MIDDSFSGNRLPHDLKTLPAKHRALLLRDLLEEHPVEHFPVAVDEQLVATLAENF